MTSLIEVATRAFKGTRTPQTMIAAVLAWSITVAPTAFGRGSSPTARLLAVLSLIAGLVGPLFLAERRRVGRHVGITAFLALALAAWLFSLPALHPMRLSPFRAATGSLAWAIFALSWREVWPRPPERAEPEPQAAPLPPRSSLHFLSIPILTAAVIGALFFVLGAFRTRDVERGLVAQAIAIACGAAVMTSASTVATTLGKDRSGGPGRRFTGTVVRALLLLFVIALGGALYILLRT